MGPDLNYSEPNCFELNCFEWTSQSSAFMDGALPPSTQKAAESHIEKCKDCAERLQRYRLILESLRNLERYRAPPEIKYERELQSHTQPKTAAPGWRRSDRLIRPILRPIKNLNSRSWTWIGISIIGFVVLTTLPKLQSLYESRLQKRLDSVNFAELPITQAPLQDISAEEDASQYDDFSGDEGEEETGLADHAIQEPAPSEWDSSAQAKAASGTIQVAGAQVWRFILRTDSPQDLRPKVHEALITAGVSPQSRMIHGFVAPGGIQFDVLAPAASITKLKEVLQKLSEEHSPTQDHTVADHPNPTQPFTWYRNRSKRPLPNGAARVVIWLSLT
jgi:hypothetical protein